MNRVHRVLTRLAVTYIILFTVAVLVAIVASIARGQAGPVAIATVARVVDGDTLKLTDGRTVRLLQIDTPESVGRDAGECYGKAAAADTREMLPPGSRVRLEPDPGIDQTDRYGRLLRYVVVPPNGINVNIRLVRHGSATPYFYRGDRGIHAARLLREARRARRLKLGLWGACRAVLDPTHAATTYYP